MRSRGLGDVYKRQDLLRAEVRKHLPGEEALHDALAHSVSVREALLSIPEADRPGILRRLARTALGQFARRCGENIALRLLVFDFEGNFYLRKNGVSKRNRRKTEKFFRDKATPPMPPLLPQKLQRQGAGSTRNSLNTTERSA